MCRKWKICCAVYNTKRPPQQPIDLGGLFTIGPSNAIFLVMKTLTKILKPLSFLPTVLMLTLIFSFSSQTGEESGNLSYQISYQIVETANHILHIEKTPDELAADAESIHLYVRKAAHMTEYFILALTVALPLFIYRLRTIPRIGLNLIICAGAAALDEYHQSFVDGRGPAVTDVCIDTTGVLIALIVIQIGCYMLGGKNVSECHCQKTMQ